MTREDAIDLLKKDKSQIGKCFLSDALDIAINVLEQEPILDKITEIIEPLRHLSIDEMSGIEWDILRVIDKYKAESEDKG